MGMFSGIKEAQMSGGGNNFRDGKYKCLVEKVHAKKGYKGSSFIAEMRIIESEAVTEYEIARDQKTTTDKLVKPNAPNTAASYVVNLKFDNALGNIKKFVLGVLGAFGYTEEQITEELIDKVIGPDQPLRGMAVAVSTYRTVNQGRANKANEGNILVLLNFDPIEQTREQVKAQREWLVSNAAGSAPAATTPAASPVQTTTVAAQPATQPAAQPAQPAVTQPTTAPAQQPAAASNPLAELGL